MNSNQGFTKIVCSKFKNKDDSNSKSKDKRSWKQDQRKQAKRSWTPKES